MSNRGTISWSGFFLSLIGAFFLGVFVGKSDVEYQADRNRKNTKKKEN